MVAFRTILHHLENNGVTDYISNPLFIGLNCIVITTFGDAFWAQGEFTASDECTILKHNCMSELIGLFVSACYIAGNKYKYSFTLKAFSQRVCDDVIKLPITPTGEPDWAYMEQYMRRVMEDCERKYQTLVQVAKRRTEVDVSG